MGKAENIVKNEVMKALMKCQKHLRFWVNSTGKLESKDGRWVKFGLVGSSDIIGVCKPSGRFLAIELKSSIGELSEEQKNFRKMITEFGGIYIEAKGENASEKVIRILKIEGVLPMDF